MSSTFVMEQGLAQIVLIDRQLYRDITLEHDNVGVSALTLFPHIIQIYAKPPKSKTAKIFFYTLGRNKHIVTGHIATEGVEGIIIPSGSIEGLTLQIENMSSERSALTRHHERVTDIRDTITAEMGLRFYKAFLATLPVYNPRR